MEQETFKCGICCEIQEIEEFYNVISEYEVRLGGTSRKINVCRGCVCRGCK